MSRKKTIRRVRKSFWMLGALAALLIVILGSSTLAMLTKKTSAVKNTFTEGTVGCEISETFDGTKKSDVTVTNKGNVPVYVRVKLVAYWQDNNGNILAKNSWTPEFTLGKNWAEGTDGFYYYTQPVKGEDSTTSLIKNSLKLVKEKNEHQVLDVLAETVQAAAKDDGSSALATANWSVTVGTDGTLTVN